MNLGALLGCFLFITGGIAAMSTRKFPYWILGKVYFIEGIPAIFLGMVFVVVGILFYFLSIENLLHFGK